MNDFRKKVKNELKKSKLKSTTRKNNINSKIDIDLDSNNVNKNILFKSKSLKCSRCGGKHFDLTCIYY